MRNRNRFIGFKATPKEAWLLEQFRNGVGYKTTLSGALQFLIAEEADRRGLVYKPPGLVSGPMFDFDVPELAAPPVAPPPPPRPPAVEQPPADRVGALVDALAGAHQGGARPKRSKPEVKKSLPKRNGKSTKSTAGTVPAKGKTKKPAAKRPAKQKGAQ